MFFNSYIFWVFFAVVLIVYRRLAHRAQNRWLLVASYIFYGYWDWRFLSLIFASTIVDFVAAQSIHKTGTPNKRWLWLSFGFFASELAVVLETIGLPVALPTLSIALPVGISFYTFQTMSYTIDVYRRKVEPCRDLINFALFVCFFPQLVAGPVERTGRLMPQIENPRPRDRSAFAVGLYHIVFGLFKKVVVADNMAPFVNAVFETPVGELSGTDCLVGVYAFAFQIYGDFSGYSSLAQGIAKWLGFDLMTNFRMPYFAKSPSDFWQRWHISLSQWLRDYLYIPLGGNRHGQIITARNLMITMILGGLWHGANWTFLAWGAFHGVLLCGYRLVSTSSDQAKPKSIVGRIGSAFVMFQFVSLGWLLFRADNIGQATGMLNRIVSDWSLSSIALSGVAMIIVFAGPLLLYEAWVETQRDLLVLLRRHWMIRAIVYSYAALMMLFFSSATNHEFIYFQF
ncbi:UNVERIFIED_CONTAM: hypothetical protein GTU68_032301 [Idotea baltica]|nr:hypothetical protein [Idotea baltica]